MPVDRSFTIESWYALVRQFEAYQPQGSYSMSEHDHAKHIAKYLPLYAPTIGHVGDRPSALQIALALVNLYREHPYEVRRTSQAITQFASQESAGSEESRLMNIYGLPYLLDTVVGPATSEYIIGMIHAERTVLWLRVNRIAQIRGELLEHVRMDFHDRITVGKTFVNVYKGRDGCGRFDAERITLRPWANSRHIGDDNALYLAESDDAVGLRILACYAPLDVAIRMLDDVLLNWPSFKA